MRQINSFLLIGFGAIGQALIPVLFSRFRLASTQIVAIDPCPKAQLVAKQLGIVCASVALTEHNYCEVLSRFGLQVDCVINLAVSVSSLDLIVWCQARDVLYLDTCVEPWLGDYAIGDFSRAAVSNYELRHQVLSLRNVSKPTAVVAHGANPGLVTHFLKIALEKLAQKNNLSLQNSFAELACQLGVRCIQIAERDTQAAENLVLNENAFYNTWSAAGLISEAWQCAELGWGTHEQYFPASAQKYSYGDQAAISLQRHGAQMQIKSWTPSIGEHAAFLITHHEACSIANMLTVHDAQGGVAYRPTTYYAYCPSEVTWYSMTKWIESGYRNNFSQHVLCNELTAGFDELGVLLIYDQGCYWYGSTLTLQQARSIAPYNNATTLQVVAGILGALYWMQYYPEMGVVEAEDMDSHLVMEIARPLLGALHGVFSGWSPAVNSSLQFRDFLISPSSLSHKEFK